MFNSTKKFSSSIFYTERKISQREPSFTQSNRKRKSNLEIPEKKINFQQIEKDVKNLWNEFVDCYQIEKKEDLFDVQMDEDLYLITILKKRFDDFLKKYEIKAKPNKNLISYNEEGSFVFNFQEIWVIYIMINKKSFTSVERCTLINSALGLALSSELLYKLFKYSNNTYKVKRSEYSGIALQNTKYKEFVRDYESEKSSKDRNNNSKDKENFLTPKKKITEIKSRGKVMFQEIIEEEDIRSDEENKVFTFIPDPSSMKRRNLNNKYVLTPVRVSSKNNKSCEKVINQLRNDKLLMSNIKIKPNKHLTNEFSKLTYKTEVFEEKLKDMVEKKEVNFNLTDLQRINNNHNHLYSEKHINVTNFLSNHKFKKRGTQEIKIISPNFNGNNNFALFEVKNGIKNDIFLTPLKKYTNSSERKLVENDLQSIYSDRKLNDFVYHPYNEEIKKILNDNPDDQQVNKTLFN
jgi:hypothetical protein